MYAIVLNSYIFYATHVYIVYISYVVDELPY